jgi:hypothetical protein
LRRYFHNLRKREKGRRKKEEGRRKKEELMNHKGTEDTENQGTRKKRE